MKELLIIFVGTKSQEVMTYEGSHLSIVECLTY
jgi:hypothetical protein